MTTVTGSGMARIPTTSVGSKSHVVYDFRNCKQGSPVKRITFDGGHIMASAGGGSSDNGRTTWVSVFVPKEGACLGGFRLPSPQGSPTATRWTGERESPTARAR